ncbi:MAG: hypothetical protein GF334_05420 [Candidatus Altiarchaeales archaeon]|nr:hypothetical protein [Candidatus Altiarchaeales archaeon]
MTSLDRYYLFGQTRFFYSALSNGRVFRVSSCTPTTSICVAKTLQCGGSGWESGDWEYASLKVIAAGSKHLLCAGVYVRRQLYTPMPCKASDGTMTSSLTFDALKEDIEEIPLEDLPLYVSLYLTKDFTRLFSQGV